VTDFEEEAWVPNFVKRQAYIEEYGCAILVIFECFEYGVCEPMALLDCGVFLAETKLV
jgi:hypothetical protein